MLNNSIKIVMWDYGGVLTESPIKKLWLSNPLSKILWKWISDSGMSSLMVESVISKYHW